MSKLPVPGASLGGYLREQRETAQLSLRQAAKAAGISNPYLSQIERGLRRPSAEILQQLAKGLSISAEQLYVQAGILDDSSTARHREAPPEVVTAVLADSALSDRQRQVLLDVYRSFVGAAGDGDTASTIRDTTTHAATAAEGETR